VIELLPDVLDHGKKSDDHGKRSVDGYTVRIDEEEEIADLVWFGKCGTGALVLKNKARTMLNLHYFPPSSIGRQRSVMDCMLSVGLVEEKTVFEVAGTGPSV